jgi:glycine/D-amino acid oxidase-like deaminating enzyme
MTISVGIIGGGIAGLASAFELLEKGYSVTLFERLPECGQGASAAPSGALIPPQGARATKISGIRSRRSLAEYPKWLARISACADISISFEKRNALRILPEPQKIRGKLLSLQQALQFEESLLITEAFGAELVDMCGRVDTACLIKALQVAVKNKSLFQLVQAEVVQCESYNHGCVVTTASHEEKHFDYTVLAGGHEALKPTQYTAKLVADWGQMIQVKAPKAPKSLVMYKKFTFIGVGDQDIWAAGYHGGERFDKYPDSKVTELLLQVTKEVFGNSCILEREWCSIRPRVPGGLPLVEPVDEHKKIYLTAGPGSNGYLFAPLMAQTLVQQLESRK